MAKRRVRSRRRRRFRYPFRKSRRHDRRMPLSVGIGLMTSAFSSPAAGWASPMDAIKGGDMGGALAGFIRSWTGIYGIDGKEPFGINLWSALNPINFGDAPAWKAALWSSVVMRLIKKVSKTDPIERIPVLKNYVKFS